MDDGVPAQPVPQLEALLPLLPPAISDDVRQVLRERADFHADIDVAAACRGSLELAALVLVKWAAISAAADVAAVRAELAARETRAKAYLQYGIANPRPSEHLVSARIDATAEVANAREAAARAQGLADLCRAAVVALTSIVNAHTGTSLASEGSQT